MANSIKTSMFVGAVAGTKPLLVNLVRIDARQQAIKEGLPRDTCLWKWKP